MSIKIKRGEAWEGGHWVVKTYTFIRDTTVDASVFTIAPKELLELKAELEKIKLEHE